jgi:hypothetical protein
LERIWEVRKRTDVLLQVLWSWESAGQTIGGSVMNHRDVDQFEVEEEDTSYPSVDSCIGLDVWVV